MSGNPPPDQGIGLSLVCAKDGDTTIVVLTGELDLSSSSLLRAELAALATSSRRIVLDMAGVSLLDSSGLGTIAAAQRTLRNDFCELTIRNPSHVARRALAISGIADHIDIVDTEPEPVTPDV